MRFHTFESFRKANLGQSLNEAAAPMDEKKAAKLIKDVIKYATQINEIETQMREQMAPIEGKMNKAMENIYKYFEQVKTVTMAVGSIEAALEKGRLTKATPAYKSVVDGLVKLHPKLAKQAEELKNKHTNTKAKPNLLSVKDKETGRGAQYEEPEEDFKARTMKEGMLSDFFDKMMSMYEKIAAKLTSFFKQNEADVKALVVAAKDFTEGIGDNEEGEDVDDWETENDGNGVVAGGRRNPNDRRVRESRRPSSSMRHYRGSSR